MSLASLLSLAACADHSGLSITGEGDAGAGAGSTGGSGGSTQTGTGGGGGQIRTGGTVGGGGQTGSGGIASGGTTGTGGAVGSGGTTGTGGTVGGGGGTPATGGSGGGNGGTGGSSADAAPMCGAVCAIFCPYGNVLDSRGCPTCQCKPATCSPVRCDIACPYGFVRDANGCEVCKCNPAPACMPVVCKLLCPYGFAKDANGCEICQCNPAPAACTTTECGPAPVLPPYACPDGSVPRAVCERNREGKCVWSVVPCPNCAGYTDATTCSKDTACAWLVPGCTDPALAAAGCYSKTLVDCASKPCPGGKTCMKRTINPCMSSTAGFAPPPGGGVPAPACTACSQVITICL